jgi:hypothetical protein
MRFLLTFLLLACVQSFVVCTQKDGSITFAQKSISLIGSENIAKVFTANTTKELIKIQPHVVFEQIHQFISEYKSFVKNTLYTKAEIVVSPIKSIQFIKDKIDFSDRYTLNCLYPKHNFW